MVQMSNKIYQRDRKTERFGYVMLHGFEVTPGTEILNLKTSFHYNDVIMGAIASQIISLTIVYSIFHSDADQRKHQSSASLAFVRWIHRGPVKFPQKWPVTRKMFPFDEVIMPPDSQYCGKDVPFHDYRFCKPGPLLLTWINSNSKMDK